MVLRSDLVEIGRFRGVIRLVWSVVLEAGRAVFGSVARNSRVRFGFDF